MRKKLILCGLFLTGLQQVYSQEWNMGYGCVGYISSRFTYRPGNLQAFVFQRNLENTEQLDYPTRLNGVHIGFGGGITMDRFYFAWEPEFINRSAVVETSDGSYKLKVRLNSYNYTAFTFGYSILKLGFSFLDLTSVYIAQSWKNPPPDTDGAKWQPLYEKKRKISFGSHFRAGLKIPFGKNVGIEAMWIHQAYWFRVFHSIPFRGENSGISIRFYAGGES